MIASVSTSDTSGPAEAGAGDAASTPPASAARRTGRSRRAPSSGRRKAREFAVQGLYAWLLGGADAGLVDAHTRELDGFAGADAAHFDALLHGCIADAAALDAAIATHLDRPANQLSPIEHAVLMIGSYELKHCLDVPLRVAINEAVELAKSFGGTDGHKYVNGVLDKVAADLRPAEAGGPRR